MIAKYYRSIDGAQPVRDFIDSLDEERQVVLENQIELLNQFEKIPFPRSSQVRGELRELRCHYGRELYRVLYRRREQFVILLHIIRKATKKLPEIDIRIAEQRWDDLEDRMNALPRLPPRAMGWDAP